jgi:excisionase family DNA binding protein
VSALRVRTEERRAFFTPRSLAEYLSISERTVRQILLDGRIPSYKIQGVRRIDPTDVDAYLARNRTGPA